MYFQYVGAYIQLPIALSIALLCFVFRTITQSNSFVYFGFGWLLNFVYLVFSIEELKFGGIEYTEEISYALSLLSNVFFILTLISYRKELGFTEKVNSLYVAMLVSAGSCVVYMMNRSEDNDLLTQAVVMFPFVLTSALSIYAIFEYMKSFRYVRVKRIEDKKSSTDSVSAVRELELNSVNTYKAINIIMVGVIIYLLDQFVYLLLFLEERILIGFLIGLFSKFIIMIGLFALFRQIQEFVNIEFNLSEISRTKESTLGTLLHELGTPLLEFQVALHDFSQENRALTPYRKTIREMESAVHRALAIVDAARAENFEGKNDELKTSNLNALVELGMSAVKKTRNNSSIQFEVQFGGKCTIECFPNDVVQVVINAVRNSYDAIEAKIGNGYYMKGHVCIKTKTEKSNISNESSKVVLTIQDDGGGIKDEHYNKFTDIGFTTSNELGRGFGTVVMNDLTQENGGKINYSNLASSKGGKKGLMVILEFPQKLK